MRRNCAKSSRGPGVATAQQSLAADKIAFVELDGKHQAGLDGTVLIADVMPPMPVGLLDAAGIEGVHSRELEAELSAGFHQRVECAAREFGRDIELPSEFADIGDPLRTSRRMANGDFAPGPVWMRRIG